MEYVVKAPGSCGELLQGRVDGRDVLITCPINRFSTAIAYAPPRSQAALLPPKARMAVDIVLRYLQEQPRFSLQLTSTLPEGKGMASSSADISAVCMASALACGRSLSQDELMKIALSIEPSDAVFCSGIVMIDYLQGTFVKELGQVPPAAIVMFDQGGSIDTVTFNERQDLREMREKQSAVIRQAIEKVKSGIAEGNWYDIGVGATMSAYANQEILYRSYLDELVEVVHETQAYGLVIAHSGTVCGVLCSAETVPEVRCKVQERCGRAITYFDTVTVYNDGIDVKVGEDHT